MFGQVITNSGGQEIPVRIIAEQHVLEDFGLIPSVELCFQNLPLEKWMFQGPAAPSRDPHLGLKRPTAQGREAVTPPEVHA